GTYYSAFICTFGRAGAGFGLGHVRGAVQRHSDPVRWVDLRDADCSVVGLSIGADQGDGQFSLGSRRGDWRHCVVLRGDDDLGILRGSISIDLWSGPAGDRD